MFVNLDKNQLWKFDNFWICQNLKKLLIIKFQN